MRSSYVKEGRTIRIEIERGRVHQLDLTEKGEAIERQNCFECRTLPEGSSSDLTKPAQPPDQLIQFLLRLGHRCERATLTSGTTSHVYRDPGGERVWSDQSSRLHVSLVNRALQLRCEIERGGATFDRAWIEELELIADAVERIEFRDTGESSLVLEPGVTAAVLAAVAGSGLAHSIGMAQEPRGGEIDGRGRVLERCRIRSGKESEIGWFRPSYRFRPRRLAHGLDLVLSDRPADQPSSKAIALLGHPEIVSGVMTLTCLVLGEDSAAIRRRLRIDLERWPDQVSVSSERGNWFPFLAGAWGRRIVVDSVE